ncbi:MULTISPECIES: response regulator [unclassified Rhizobium]|uniref:response regulator transcription factor n=1 Tax=unclassified Rhizobium TaxID=2613769 RepID=UPI0017AC1C7F|nr:MULTISPECIES: response regulator [unclassified Rhizobium]MBB3289118.1 FixJ family two-component response regulator [Rhizobium sp. BK252]MBB3403860.1 FixJ family two-component response regulator [Rhizobium sp. BK289]MBB3416471.1 FixJ family two-component response regulator [Rhizobium sp. BK284]MBB3484323.1 FixJ family two-component response regulator [Rhizobium sp. BK347]MDK4717978.1 response regulator [Rhizobium sp. CNPSo 3968]
MMISASRRATSSTLNDDLHKLGCVAVIEDDPDTRMLVADLIENVGFSVVRFAGALEFLSSPLTVEPSCILLDVRLQGMSGLDLQQRLSHRGSQSLIVFMTGFADVSMSVRAMKAGAFDFLQKPFREQEVLDAVCAAALAYRHRAGINRTKAAIDRRFHSLTSREREVLEGVVDGLLNKQIAAILGISEITVKVHRANLMKKMQARTLVDLIRDVSLHLSFERSQTLANADDGGFNEPRGWTADTRSVVMPTFA